MKTSFTIVDINPANVQEETVYCIKNVKSPGFEKKKLWFTARYEEGLRMHILKDPEGKMAGFIEYLPGAKAWRPVKAKGYMFIHCLFVYPAKNKNLGYGTALVKQAEMAAREQGYSGICAMTSEGAWMSDASLFLKLGFEKVDQRGRFDLVCKTWDTKAPLPELRNWEEQQASYPGWHLVYADQCPWHDKAVEALWNVAQDYGIELKLSCLESAKAAQNAPSGFGVFSLLHDGKLLEDHYLSATRFRNILKKELVVES